MNSRVALMRWGLLAWVLVTLPVTAQPEAPQPTVGPIQPEVVVVDDFPYSWLHWWETAGWRYMEEEAGQRDRPWDHPAARRYRAEAEAALLARLNDRDAKVREQALLALARMGYEPLVERLFPPRSIEQRIAEEEAELFPDEPVVGGNPSEEVVPAVTTFLEDRNAGVRCAGWLALGLLDTAASREALLHDVKLGEEDAAARAIGIGLMSVLDVRLRAALEQILGDPSASIEVKRWAVWALGRHDSVAGDDGMDAVLRRVPSTFVISEALGSDGYVWRRGGANWLARVLEYDPSVRQWAGYLQLRDMPSDGAYGSSPGGLAMQSRTAASLALLRIPPEKDASARARLAGLLIARASSGTRDGWAEAHRGPDALAFAVHQMDAVSGLDQLFTLMQGTSTVPPPPPTLDEDGEPIPRDRPNEPIDAYFPDRPVRGYAAIGIGLMLRRMTPGTQLHEAHPAEIRPRDLDRIKRRFGQRLANEITDFDEPMEYRAACALALGLSDDPRYIPELNARLSRLGAGDELVLGYGLLALAMLGEAEAADVALRYVTRPGAVGGKWDILGRGAAMQAVALLGDDAGQAGRGTLTGAWGKNPWVSLAAAECAAQAGWYGLAPMALESAREGRGASRLAGVIALGALYESRYPSPLASITRDANYTLAFRPDRFDQTQELVLPVEGEPAPPEPSDYRPADWPIRRFYIYADPYLYDVLLRR